MANIVDLYKKNIPATGKANTKGIDKTPIGVEFPFDKSKDLMKGDLSKYRKGALGKGSGGYDNSRTYTSVTRKK